MENNQIVIYQTEDGQTQIDVRMENETVWLTQKQIAELFGTKRPAITKHLKNIYASEELDENSTCSILEHMGNEGKQVYSTKYYNLDAILSVGYRVNSKNATRFRQWANKVVAQKVEGGRMPCPHSPACLMPLIRQPLAHLLSSPLPTRPFVFCLSVCLPCGHG